MPKNPFNQGGADPLAGNAGGGAWGAAGVAGAGGFGNGTNSAAYEAEEYDVVDIEAPAATAKTSVKATPAAAAVKKGKGVFSNLGGGGSTNQREADIKAKEAELKKREADVAAREAALRAGGVLPSDQTKNFPPCLPMVHHDIGTDIPPDKRPIMRKGFFIFMLTITALTFNLVAVVIALIEKAVDEKVMTAIFAALYVFLGIPGAWILWYSRLYTAMRRDGAFSFAAFFCTFVGHIAFCVWAAIAPDLSGRQYSFAGIITALELVDNHKLSSIFYFTGFALWATTGALSFFYLCAVYAAFRNSGGPERLQYEAQSAGVQMAANHAAQGAANGGRR